MSENAKRNLAQLIRILSAPSLTAIVFMIILKKYAPIAFPSWMEIRISLIFLSALPMSAYIIWALVPSLRKQGRKSQRKMAFIFSGAGYVGAFIYGALFSGNPDLAMVTTIYLVSVLLLIFCNKVLHSKASGHSCGVAGPMIVCVYYFGVIGLLIGGTIYLIVFWASIESRRHTAEEFLEGTFINGLASVLTFACFMAALV